MKYWFLVLCASSVLAAEHQTPHDEIHAWCAATHELLDASGPGAYLARASNEGYIYFTRIKHSLRRREHYARYPHADSTAPQVPRARFRVRN